MSLNFCFANSVDIEVTSDCSLASYLEEEYSEYVVTRGMPYPRLRIDFEEMSRGLDGAHDVRSPVGFSTRGVFLYDRKLTKLYPDLGNFGVLGYTVTCDPRFNPQFFSIIFEYLVSHLLIHLGEKVFCHSSAVRYKDRVLLFPAWRNTGKTNILLEFLSRGADYIADDWSILTPDGCIERIPKRLNLLNYNFTEKPELLEAAPPDTRVLVDMISRAEQGQLNIGSEALEQLKLQARYRVAANKLFPECKLVDGPVPVDHVVFLRRSFRDVIYPSVQNDPGDVVLSTLKFEHLYFSQAYIAHTGLGHLSSSILDHSWDRARSILEAFFRTIGKQTYTVSTEDTVSVVSAIEELVGA